ncbi:MAG: hypothetical protein Q8K71_15960 [Polaromonas sp.]|uniref:hypothetical protein n=1 Tax=Polaromonas sp. TaxID=1869339 RepID=UPI0027305791|nr:hypothetical protein [Polaromonas sp.]MDP1740579.1 hypothetical protein [Polaromonas sp.]MDP1955966.1 hypothetical protein [Polaromonas sp.]MDP3752855.1 hypothetical protein [Polaromonas sp.]
MIRIFATAAAVAVLAGCATTQSTPPTFAGCRTWEQQAGSPQLSSVAVLSPELAKVIGVQEVSTSRTGSGMAAVQTTVYNCSDVDVVLTMRTRFTGDRGQSEPPSVWKTVFLAPRGQATYGESAISQATNKVAVDIYDGNRGQSQFAPGQTYQVPPR